MKESTDFLTLLQGQNQNNKIDTLDTLDAEEIALDQLRKAKEHTERLVSQMQDVSDITGNFASDLDGTKGLAVFGPAGVGKTEAVSQALKNVNANVEYLKGADISPAGLYCTLWFNKDKHRILVLDDVDIVGGGEKAKQIMALLKAATENTYKPRELSWIKAAPNATMKEYNIPMKFQYWGNIIWITNDDPRAIMKKPSLAPHFKAILSRFTPVILDWNKQDNYAYTKYLITEKEMLGKNCRSKKNGYPKEVIDDTLWFFKTHGKDLMDITPRLATKVAHNRLRFHDDGRWIEMSKNTAGFWE